MKTTIKKEIKSKTKTKTKIAMILFGMLVLVGYANAQAQDAVHCYRSVIDGKPVLKAKTSDHEYINWDAADFTQRNLLIDACVQEAWGRECANKDYTDTVQVKDGYDGYILKEVTIHGYVDTKTNKNYRDYSDCEAGILGSVSKVIRKRSKDLGFGSKSYSYQRTPMIGE